jgi:hypothetical protein
VLAGPLACGTSIWASCQEQPSGKDEQPSNANSRLHQLSQYGPAPS